MNNLRELLRDADPLRHEQERPLGQRTLHRQTVLAAAHSNRAPVDGRLRTRSGVFAASALMVIAAVVLGAILWSVFNSNLQAAIRFEVRLAESKPAPGLQKAQVAGSHRYVYLHHKFILNNNDIAAVHVVQEGGPSQYAISIEFNAAGADKMRRVTQSHIGKLFAVLLDGQVAMAPVIRSSIGDSAVITGNFTKAEAKGIAQRIVKGIGKQ
jgi:SecDF, P1 head subdomain